MNAVDATNRTDAHEDAEPPSLITIILDTNPHAWALLEDSLSLSKLVANLLVFINAHLAINHANRVAVIASHSERAEWLYPTPVKPKPHKTTTNGNPTSDEDSEMRDASGDISKPGGPVHPPDDANKYRPFARIEQALTTNINHLTSTTTPSEFSSNPTTMMAGALTLALTYISKQTAALPTSSSSTQFNYSDPTSIAGGNDLSASAGATRNLSGLTSRILIISVSGDLSTQYIPVMNSIFACQRLGIPIDILKLAGDTVFLQQAADVTAGIYMSLSDRADGNGEAGVGPRRKEGVLQFLMSAYLPDREARRYLSVPGGEEGGGVVDFRAACFCHRRVVDVGYVCSICLSIFCSGELPEGRCLTCGTELAAGNFGRPPAVIQRIRKKGKKGKGGNNKAGGGGGAAGGAFTPESRAGTPANA